MLIYLILEKKILMNWYRKKMEQSGQVESGTMSVKAGDFIC